MQKALTAAAAVILWGTAGCSSWQQRADALQTALAGFVASGQTHKDDFIRRYGPPSACSPATAGELCGWDATPSDAGGSSSAPNGSADTGPIPGVSTSTSDANAATSLQVEFDASGRFVKGRSTVRHEGRDYLGHAEASNPNLDFLRQTFLGMAKGTPIRLTFLDAAPPFEGLFRGYNYWENSIVVRPENGGSPSQKIYSVRQIESVEPLAAVPAPKPAQAPSASTATATGPPALPVKARDPELASPRNAP